MSEGTTVLDIMDSARSVYLNDPSGAIFTQAKLLPIIKEVYGYLQTALEKNGVQCKNEQFQLRVPANTTTLPIIPADFLWPVLLEERLYGSSDLFTSMTQRRWPPSVLPTDKLIYWTWNGEIFQLVGATTDREVKLSYWKKFPALVDASTLVLGKSEQFMAAKVAAVAHKFISQNESLAEAANSVADESLEEIINIFIKKQPPVRRKPYIPFR